MKFTEHLSAHLTPEWRSQYIRYEVSLKLPQKSCVFQALFLCKIFVMGLAFCRLSFCIFVYKYNLGLAVPVSGKLFLP